MYNHNSNQFRERSGSNQFRERSSSCSNKDINNYNFQNQNPNIRQTTYNYLQQPDFSYLAPPVKHNLPQISPIAIPMPNAPQLAFCNRNINHQTFPIPQKI